MLGQQLEKKTSIQPVGILEGVVSRVFRSDPEAERGVSYRKTEIDQQGALVRFLGQSDRKIAGNSRDAGAALGAEKHELPAASPLCWASSRTEDGRGPDQSFRQSILVERRSEKLTSARTHATEHPVPIGHLRIDHHGRRIRGANALH